MGNVFLSAVFSFYIATSFGSSLSRNINRAFGFFLKMVVISSIPPLYSLRLQLGTHVPFGTMIRGGIFMLIKGRSIKNPLIIGFLSIDSNLQLYAEYLLSNSSEIKEKINYNFNKYYYKVRLISYLSKLIYYEAVNYDKKIRKSSKTFLLVLDKPFEDGNSILLDKVTNKHTNREILESDKVGDYIHDFRLFKAVEKLTERQKHILYLAYIKDLQDTEIAKLLMVSQQSISKTKKTAVRKIRGELDAG